MEKKDTNVQSPLMETWPDYTFEEIEKVDVDDRIAKFFCRSFFRTMHLPETMIVAFYTLLFKNQIPL